jgi:hypothetical protein
MNYLGRCALIGILALAAPLTLAKGPSVGERSFVIAGSGVTDDSVDVASYSLAGQLGWFWTEAVEFGIRQSISGVYVDDGDSRWAGATRAYVDWHFGTEGILPFIGASVGGVYGRNTNNTGAAGLEAGAKWYVRDKTFILTMLEWQWLWDGADDIADTFDDGAFYLTVGVGFNF